MGRSPSVENGLKKGPWTPEEDQKLVQHIQKHGHGSWRALPKLAGLNRCGKSCRLRWTNYLRPDIKRGKFSQEEEQTILHLHSILGNKWSAIASHLPGRTDNEIKNFWNTHLKKKLIQMGFDPMTHRPRTDLFSTLPHLLALANLIDHNPLEEHAAKLQAEAIQLAKLQYLQYLLHSTAPVNPSPNSHFGILERDSLNLLNLIPSIKENPVSNSSLMENQTQFSIENGISQLLHQPINSSPLPDPQVPFNFQTPLNTEMGQGSNNFTMVSQEDNPPNSPWIISSGSSSTLPPLIESSTSNPGDENSPSSYGGSASSWWPELLFEEPIMHEIP
ncbi:unnamed protein product [Ilex paraguariensis]|uniref:Uncharacterized protein n=1 Tax=Ilex paraguariensis TaxID=185542 RepID=A0ABC8SBK8_9AQUA